MHHWFAIYLFYPLVGSVISHMDVVTVLQAQSKTHQLALATLCFPQNEGQGPVGVVLLDWDELNSLSSSLDKELV